jgi:hypothetical protein
MKLYGEKFEMAGDPVAITDGLVLVDAIDWRSGQMRRARISAADLEDGKRASRVNDSAP